MLEDEVIHGTIGEVEAEDAASRRDSAAATMRNINQAWLDGRVNDLAPLIHPDIVMAIPGFAARSVGRSAFLAGFRDFCENAVVHEFREQDPEVDLIGDTAVVTFRYDMVYERSGERWRTRGRDLWVLRLDAGKWRAVWRAMLDLEEDRP